MKLRIVRHPSCFLTSFSHRVIGQSTGEHVTQTTAKTTGADRYQGALNGATNAAARFSQTIA